MGRIIEFDDATRRIMKMMEKVGWGIVGTGRIARKMAEALGETEGARFVAVGSRSVEKAQAFAAEFGRPKAYGSYEGLFKDTQIDVVYIATPHPMHADNALSAMDAGKAVLCEKPIGMDATEAERMVARARDRGVFFMEAMWTRFMPAIRDLKARVERGDIGELRMFSADFGFRVDYDPESRLFNPSLGGGALLDVGIYPVSMAHHLLGVPSRLHAEAAYAPTETDEQTAILLRYPQGQLATLTCSVQTNTAREAVLCGTEGMIRIQPNWWRGTSYTFVRPNGDQEVFEPETHSNGFVYEAAETVRSLREGLLESPTMTLKESVEVMRTMDAIRDQSRGG